MPQTNVESLIREYREGRGLPVEENVPNNYPERPMAERIPNNQTFVSGGDLRTAINTVRQCVSTVEKYGFTVDSEEFDFEDMYQIIIKINKNK
jgi:hypothetical protein